MCTKTVKRVAGIVLMGVGLGCIVVSVLSPEYFSYRSLAIGREIGRMSLDNQDDWGEVPGSRGLNITHKLTPYEVINPFEVRILFQD